MPKVALTAAALLVSVSCLGSAQAATLGRFTDVYVFGDSLSDPGNTFALTESTLGAGYPPAPYYAGRVSNGPVWAEHVTDAFEAKGLQNANYAYAFGRAVKNVDTEFGPVQIPDLPDQIDKYVASGAESHLGHRPLGLVWAGSNDIFGGLQENPAAIATTASAAAQAVVDGIGTLAEHGLKNIVVLNLPPIELTPRILGAAPPAGALAKLGTDTFNDQLASLVAGIAGTAHVTVLDLHTAQLGVIGDPASYGLTDVTHACFDGVSVCADPSKYLYFELDSPDRRHSWRDRRPGRHADRACAAAAVAGADGGRAGRPGGARAWPAAERRRLRPIRSPQNLHLSSAPAMLRFGA